MEDYAGRVLADRYRLPMPPADAYDVTETRAFDTYSGQEVLVRQVPLPEVVEAEVVGPDGAAVEQAAAGGRTPAAALADPGVRRAVEAAQSAAQVPDHPRLDQVFDVFAEAGSLWIVSELVAARPLAELIAERPLTPYRAAEIASDLLTAVRVLHGHGWVHRNITVRTVLVCDDGRVVLTGLAAGAAEEALCGYAPVPRQHGAPEAAQATGVADGTSPRLPAGQEPAAGIAPPAAPGFALPQGARPYGYEQYARPAEPVPAEGPYTAGVPAPGTHAAFGGAGAGREDSGSGAGAESPYGVSTGTSGALPRPPRQQSTPGVPAPYGGPNAQPALPTAPTGNSASEAVRAARAGAIAAYRAGARAAARAPEEPGEGRQGRPEYQQQAPEPQAPEGQAPGPQTPDGRDARSPLPPPGQEPHRPQGYGSEAEPQAGQRTDGSVPPDAPPERGERPDAAGEESTPPGPDWWSLPPSGFPDPEGDADGDDDPPSPYRPRLNGIWRDGPGPFDDSAGHVPAGGGRPGGGSGRGGQDRPRSTTPALPAGFTPADGGGGDAPRAGAAGHWDGPVPAGAVAAGHGGPAGPLAAERARQARIAVVGAVTERWAPEQAGPVHENWQLAPPIGPATDLWALGALLYRVVQGHAPYPEENAAELVQLVCSEPPAYAEDCGPLRPVVESLLRQDPTERPDFEELRGWLRSLVRSAPEPDAGQDLVSVPTVDGRLPIKRRKGELVRRRRRWGRGRAAAERDSAARHRHKRGGRPVAERPPAAPATYGLEPSWAERDAREGRGLAADLFEHASPEPHGGTGRANGAGRTNRTGDTGRRAPRALGRTLLILILLGLVAAVVYAMAFMPKSGDAHGQSVKEAPSGAAAAPAASGGSASTSTSSASAKPRGAPTVAAGSGTRLAKGYVIRKDPEGFQVAVRRGWKRSPINDSGQVRYASGNFTLIVVPGRDTVQADGSDPLAYQSDKEPELRPFRSSTWASASGLRRIDVGNQAMAEGQYTWQDSNGATVYVRNLAMIVKGRYHVIQVIGPDSQRDEVSEIYQQATASYKADG
ncbi:protein kinase [Streptomyces sp. NRRL F-5126]|uniref:protein kinase n=1 Tax=Streptomyces sp. NRRL F-5126 TaxID=1463857 RepID=UPI0004C61485|nr:protein kinase [Streptomyces sp. NRRL F-5126]